MNIRLDAATLDYSASARGISNVSCEIGAGERVAIIGPSGAGKTSLLRLLSTAMRPTSGSVAVLGENPWQLSPRALRRLRARIGVVHQAAPLPPRQRVVTAVLAGRLGRWPLWKSFASLAYPLDIDGAEQALSRLGVSEKLYARCDALSGGQLQRVGVARVLYQQPDLILTDEPVSAVDPTLSDRVVSELNRESVTRGVTLIASLHAVDLALRWFPRIVGVRGGEIMFDLPPVRVNDSLLEALYASESGKVPTQDNQPLAPVSAGIRRKPLCS